VFWWVVERGVKDGTNKTTTKGKKKKKRNIGTK
jgi:hypothetical protein